MQVDNGHDHEENGVHSSKTFCKEQDDQDQPVDFISEEDMNMDVVVECQSEHHEQSTQTANPTSSNSYTQTLDNLLVGSYKMSIEDYKHDEPGVKYFTGLDCYQTFCDVLASLGPAAYELNYLYNIKPKLSVKDQLFLTLLRLRRPGKTYFELKCLFKLSSESDAYSIFVTWVRFMSLQWREIEIWPDRDLVRFYAPLDFKKKFPTTRAVFDGYEHPIKKPKAPAAQQVSFSTYKNRNTSKQVVGVTPGGLTSFVSHAYGGATSDRQIIERSDILSKVDPGDSIMADKGFDVQDIFAPFDVTVNIPTFFKKKNRIGGITLVKDRKISSKRVHVERVIGLGKTYKILCEPLDHTEALMANDIGFVCFMLANFRKCIVPKHA